MSDVPEVWERISFAEATDKIGSGATPKGGHSAYQASGIPLIRSQNVHFKGFTDAGLVFLSDAQAEKLNGVIVRTNDVLLNITGASIGRVTVAPERMDGARVNQHVAIIRPKSGIEPAFIAGFLSSPVMQQFIVAENYGVTRQALTKIMIEEIKLPLPPLPEQRRIVAKIDSLTGKCRRARDHLDHIPRLVEKYKQAVLNIAFSHLAERTRLLDMVASERGIPYGIVQTGTPYEGGIPTVRCGDVKDFCVGLDQLKRVDPEIEQGYQRTRLKGGEVLIAIRGSVGETCVVPAQLAGCNISREVAMIPPKSNISSEFIMYFLATSEAKRFILGNTKGVAQQGINLRDLKELPTPDCSLNEQIAVVARIETAFTWIDRLAADSSSARRLIDHLDQAALAKAFKGELVPQDPADEPASVLLDRIRAERAAAPKAKRGRKKAA